MKKILKIAGILYLMYYILIISYAGIRTTFSKFWLALSALFLGLSVLPSRWLSIIKYPMGLCGTLFCIQEYKMLRMAHVKPKADADYLIILGARVKGRKPTRSLLRRIYKAAEYLKENPETKVIVSGGQGPGEDITEAQSICDTLTVLGIDRNRILLEDKSESTRENLSFSYAMIKPEAACVVVTNGFHMYRTLKLAENIGITHISGLAATSEPILLPNYYVREFFALIQNIFMNWSERI